MATAAANQIGPMRETKDQPSEKLLLVVVEAVLGHDGVGKLSKGWGVFAFDFVQQRRQMREVPMSSP